MERQPIKLWLVCDVIGDADVAEMDIGKDFKGHGMTRKQVQCLDQARCCQQSRLHYSPAQTLLTQGFVLMVP